MMNENMEIDNKSANRKYNKRRIHLPNENWLDVYSWIDRKELGKNTSLAFRQFSRVAHIRTHQKCNLFLNKNVRTMHSVSVIYQSPQCLQRKGEDRKTAAFFVNIPEHNLQWQTEIPKTPLPENIDGIRGFTIKYFDSNVLSFFENIKIAWAKQLLNVRIGTLKKFPKNLVVLPQFLPMFTELRFALDLTDDFVEFFVQLPQLLSLCQTLTIHLKNSMFGHLFTLFKWLNKPREAKLLRFKVANAWEAVYFISLMQVEFRTSVLPTSYMIVLQAPPNSVVTGFTACYEKNPYTGEQFTIQLPNSLVGPAAVITRCMNGKRENMISVATDVLNELIYCGVDTIFECEATGA